MDRETALRELSQGSLELQRRAARMLSRWTDDQVHAALVDALHSPHRGLRDAATDSLLEIGDARTVRFLVPVLQHSAPGVRNAGRLLLQRLAQAAPEIIVELSRDPDVRMRIFAADIMTESGDHDLAAPLLALLDDVDENVRDAAVVGLGRLGAPEAVHRLEEIASKGATWSRFSAIDSLGQIPSDDAVRALLRLLLNAPEEILEPVAVALGRQGSPEAAGPLVESLRRHPGLAPAMVGVLAGLPAAEVSARVPAADRPLLVDAIVHRLQENGLDASATVGCLALLGELGTKVDISLFVRLLASRDRDIQRAAIHAVVGLRLHEAVPLLRQIQSKGDPALADEVRSALLQIGQPGKERL